MKESIEYKSNNFMNKIVIWCNNVGLQIATDKTEIIILTGMRIPKVINVNIGNKTIITSKNIKDLNIMREGILLIWKQYAAKQMSWSQQ